MLPTTVKITFGNVVVHHCERFSFCYRINIELILIEPPIRLYFGNDPTERGRPNTKSLQIELLHMCVIHLEKC